ncbi:hypothetical protein [Butyricimonas sp. Marseille-P3923]|uniref:hypothetical protein n=1 Tax=Butyricimonas sp. Marseille-P3923 TaxID=1987504 RepID=UPI000C08837D|nr:hypothetical protein [Butyricimonas sp. Marseille-P3923]
MANNIIYPVATLLQVEPFLVEYFAYNRTMLYTEIERMYLATWGFMGKVEDKYMIEVPNTLDELATSDNPFDRQRYAPREQKMIKVVDTLAYMTDNIKGILFEDDGLKKKIEELTSELPDKNRDAIFYTLWMLAIIYKKHEAFKPILDPELLEETYNMDTYFQQVRPEMLQLYLFLERDKRKKDKSITLSNNQEKITINNAMESWFTNLLDSYLHVYLGVNSIEEAEEELKEVYSPKKGRKADNPAQNLVMVGIYRLLVNRSGMERKSDIYKFILDYMELIGLVKDEESQIDENYINSKIAYLDKHGYKPEWIPASQGNYRTSPNNPSKLYFW